MTHAAATSSIPGRGKLECIYIYIYIKNMFVHDDLRVIETDVIGPCLPQVLTHESTLYVDLFSYLGACIWSLRARMIRAARQ